MRIIPVIDVMAGQVVRAVGGRRSEYRPIRSTLTDSTDPVDVARALIEKCNARELYVADIDAITSDKPCVGLVEHLISSVQVEVWADVGIRSIRDHGRLPNKPRVVAVIASETIEDPYQLGMAAAHFAPLIFSVDLKGGRWLGNPSAWHSEGVTSSESVTELVDAAIRIGWSPSILLLDLDSVGTGRGSGTVRFCREIKQRWPETEVITGGGVRNWDDIRRLEDAGADGVLVATALHDGTLTFPRPTG